MKNYSREDIEKWKTDWDGKLTRVFQGGQVNKSYIVRTTDGSPLPESRDILICFADNWWPCNFGGSVTRKSESEAHVVVYVD